MNQMTNNDPLDPNLLKKLKTLRDVPPRDPNAAAQSHARFMAELDDLFPVGVSVGQSRYPNSILHMIKETLTMKTFAYRTTLTTLGIAVFILLFLFGGTRMVARASENALPGDALYPVKTSLEQARMSLAADAKDQAGLYLELANRRLAEIESLAGIGRFDEIGSMAEQFRLYADKALKATALLAQTDPGLAAQLNGEINQSLSRFAQALGRIASQNPGVTVPGPEMPGGTSSGNENGAANNANENGTSDGNANGNESNQNGIDDNSNDGNDNANGNSDDHGSNDNANGNGNTNGDDHGSGDDQNGNVNDDTNDNGSGRGGDDSDSGSDDNGSGDDKGSGSGGDDGSSGGSGGDDDSGGGSDDSGSGGGSASLPGSPGGLSQVLIIDRM